MLFCVLYSVDFSFLDIAFLCCMFCFFLSFYIFFVCTVLLYCYLLMNKDVYIIILTMSKSSCNVLSTQAYVSVSTDLPKVVVSFQPVHHVFSHVLGNCHCTLSSHASKEEQRSVRNERIDRLDWLRTRPRSTTN